MAARPQAERRCYRVLNTFGAISTVLASAELLLCSSVTGTPMAKNLPERKHTIAVAATERDAIVSVRLYLRQPARVVQHWQLRPCTLYAAAALTR